LKSDIPLNALRAFEASARHLNFTRAGMELFVSQAAVSQQVRLQEERLGVILFKRLSRGLELTDEAQLLFSKISEEFHRIEKAYRQFEIGKGRAWDSDGITGITAISRLAGLSFFKKRNQ